MQISIDRPVAGIAKPFGDNIKISISGEAQISAMPVRFFARGNTKNLPKVVGAT
jgi:hypothetical protein